jgi:hypothetical protein
VMLWLYHTRLGGIRGMALGATLAKLLAAAAVMGIIIFVVAPFGGVGDTFIAKLWRVLLPSLAAMLAYAAALKLVRVREADVLAEMVRRRALNRL